MEICYKNPNGLTVEINYMTLKQSRSELLPIYIADKNDNCIALEKEDVLWLRDSLDKIYKDLYQ